MESRGSISVKPLQAPSSLRRRRAGGRGGAIAFLLPSLAGVCVFVLIPFADVVRRSFTSAMGGQFAGVRNYVTVFQNRAFQLAAGNTLRFLIVCIPLLLAVSLVLALILYEIAQRAGLFKTAFLAPLAIPVASVVLLWRLLFDPSGFLNSWVAALGGTPVDWMDTVWAFWVLVGSYLWKNVGYDMVLWMAGLAAINPSLFEAAKVDGAGRFIIFWRITLPNLLPSLFTILALSLINAFKVFREAYLVAGEYPHSSIYLLQHLFNNWFRDLSMDKLSAAAVVVAACVLLLIAGLRRAWEKED